MDPYLVLGVPADASLEVIRAAYLKAAKLVHPDRFMNDPQHLRDEAARRMIELNEAYRLAYTDAVDPRDAPQAWARRMCTRCEPPVDRHDFQCARCKAWWSPAACTQCGALGWSTGGGGAMYFCDDCADRGYPPACGACGAPGNPANPASACSVCGVELHRRRCGYCGVPALVTGANAAFDCIRCHQHNWASF